MAQSPFLHGQLSIRDVDHGLDLFYVIALFMSTISPTATNIRTFQIWTNLFLWSLCAMSLLILDYTQEVHRMLYYKILCSASYMYPSVLLKHSQSKYAEVYL